MGIRYFFYECPVCHRAGNGNSPDACDNCAEKDKEKMARRNFRISTNGERFRIEAEEPKTIGFLWWKKTKLMWYPLSANGRKCEGINCRWISEYLNLEETNKCLKKFKNIETNEVHAWIPITNN